MDEYNEIELTRNDEDHVWDLEYEADHAGTVELTMLTEDTIFDRDINVSVTVPQGRAEILNGTDVEANPDLSVNNDTGVVTAYCNKGPYLAPYVTPGYVSEPTRGILNVHGDATLQLTTKSAAVLHPSANQDQTIPKGTFLTGDQLVPKVKLTNLDASNIAYGVTVQVGEAANPASIASVTGTYTGGRTATPWNVEVCGQHGLDDADKRDFSFADPVRNIGAFIIYLTSDVSSLGDGCIIAMMHDSAGTYAWVVDDDDIVKVSINATITPVESGGYHLLRVELPSPYAFWVQSYAMVLAYNGNGYLTFSTSTMETLEEPDSLSEYITPELPPVFFAAPNTAEWGSGFNKMQTVLRCEPQEDVLCATRVYNDTVVFTNNITAAYDDGATQITGDRYFDPIEPFIMYYLTESDIAGGDVGANEWTVAEGAFVEGDDTYATFSFSEPIYNIGAFMIWRLGDTIPFDGSIVAMLHDSLGTRAWVYDNGVISQVDMDYVTAEVESGSVVVGYPVAAGRPYFDIRSNYCYGIHVVHGGVGLLTFRTATDVGGSNDKVLRFSLPEDPPFSCVVLNSTLTISSTSVLHHISPPTTGPYRQYAWVNSSSGLCSGDTTDVDYQSGELVADYTDYSAYVMNGGTYTCYYLTQADLGISGARTSYELIYSDDYTVNTSSETASLIDTIDLPAKALTSGKMLYVKIRDKAGPRSGYFTGSDSIYINTEEAKGTATYSLEPCTWLHTRKNGVLNTGRVLSATYGYGVWADPIQKANGAGSIDINAKWDSNSGTINGTYNVSVYLLDYAPNGNPFDYSF